MPITGTTQLYALASTGVLALLAVGLERPDDVRAATDDGARFAAPVQVPAGDGLLGERRMYPSPSMHDWNGDGRLDVVVGDLAGRVTVAERGADGLLAAEVKMKRRDGEPLEFNNW